MGLLEQTIDALKAAGLRAEESYPGRPMPHLTDVAAAVSVREVDLREKTVTLAVTVMAPFRMGGAACRAPAATAAQVLEELGGVWLQGPCALNRTGDYFQVEVTAVFSGQAAEEGWAEKTAFTVQQGDTVFPHAVGFTMVQTIDPLGTATLENSPITIQLEERFAPGELETVLSSRDFTLRITRPTSIEILRGCRWTSIRRVDSSEGLRQVRSGEAAGRTVANVLN